MSASNDFVHLHVHSEYSLLDGASKILEIIETVKKHNMRSVALTDHGNMYGVIKFYSDAKEHGIKPIIGCEMYLAPRTRFDKETREDRSPYHLTVLAKNAHGYKNLIQLVTASNFEGFYQKPRIDKELLVKHKDGLIILSGCLAGEIPSLILNEKYDDAKSSATWFKEVFGKDFYLELMDNGIPEQMIVLKNLLNLSKELDIQVVATNDTHYTNKEDAKAQDVLMCIGMGKTIDDENRMKFYGEEFYIKTPEEMYKLFKEIPEALENTLEISEKCELEIETGKPHFPDFPVPQGHTHISYLRELVKNGLVKRYGEKIPDNVQDRVNYELSVIEKMGYAPIFLVVQDFINFAKDNGIEVGPGRGSAAGSIVAYAVGITEIDPIKYGLIFERFLNSERVTMPDIDTDFCFERRQEVINYVCRKYGSDHVAQIITFGTMAARAAVRDCGRVLNIPLSEVDKIAKLILPNDTINNSIEKVRELKNLYYQDPKVKNLLDTAKTLEGTVRHSAVHAAGVVISQKPLCEYVPLQKSGDDQIVTQYAMKEIEKIGLLKMDFLGLKNLTMIANTLKFVKELRGIEVNIKNIPLDDKKTFELLASGETLGIFQLESQGMRTLIKNLQPSRFEDVIALLALHRPGPLESGMVEDFILRKKGLKKVVYEIHELEEILSETYGVILYQEQVMQIASKIAGFSMGEADILRHAMGKKNIIEMTKQKEKFISGAIKRGYPEDKVKNLFSLCEKFAEYGFNKSHSTAYALISYQTAFLKANFPKEFMAALLTSSVGETDKINSYIGEANRIGIKILPPDINESSRDFFPVEAGIRFAFSAIKNVGYTAIEEIENARQNGGRFKSFKDFISRVNLRKVNKKVIESLIKAGAFDSIGYSRAGLLSVYEELLSKIEKNEHNQSALFGDFVSSFDINDISLTTDIPEFPKDQLLRMEKELLGIYVSEHPLSQLNEQLKMRVTCNISDIATIQYPSQIVIGGLLKSLRRITTKKNDLMMFGELEDLTGSIPLVFFPKTFEKYSFLLNEDTPVIIKGKVDKRQEQIQVIVDSVELLENENLKRSLHIKLPDSIKSEELKSLKSLLVMNKGNEKTFLHLGEKIISASDDYSVTISQDLIQTIENLLGKDSVWIEFDKNGEEEEQ